MVNIHCSIASSFFTVVSISNTDLEVPKKNEKKLEELSSMHWVLLNGLCLNGISHGIRIWIWISCSSTGTHPQGIVPRVLDRSQQLLLNSTLAAVHHPAVLSDLTLISCKHSWRCHLDISGNHGIEESLLIIGKRLLNECGSRIQGKLSIDGEQAAPIVGIFEVLTVEHNVRQIVGDEC